MKLIDVGYRGHCNLCTTFRTMFFSVLFILFPILLANGQQTTTTSNKEDNNTNHNETKGSFQIIHLHNNKDDNFKSLCAVNLNSPSINDENYYPFLFHENENLCNPKTSHSSHIEYHSFLYSNKCSTSLQVKNFVENYVKPNSDGRNPIGLVFSTPCNLNLTAKFNFSQDILDLINHYNVSISVIDASKAKNLSIYNELRRVSNHDSSQPFFHMLVLLIIASSIVFVGSYWSGNVRFQIYVNSIRNLSTDNAAEADANDTDETSLSHNEPKKSSIKQEQAFSNLSLCPVIMMVICMVSMLLLLYYFYVYFSVVILYFFLGTSMVSMFVCVKAFAAFILPEKLIKLSFKFPKLACISAHKVHYLDLLIVIISISFPLVWFAFRSHDSSWILQDILGSFFCINMLLSLRLPSLRICTFLLLLLFFYDIFFVFITPFITPEGKSIMVEVATGGRHTTRVSFLENRCDGLPSQALPMLFLVPIKMFGYDPFSLTDVCAPKSFSMLGYGDVMIPGLLVAYSASFDLIKNIPYHLYFSISLVSYVIGLIVTYAALILMNGAGQPALLYLVPCTLLPVTITSLIRKEFKDIWRGPEKSMASSNLTENNADLQDNGQQA